MSDKVYLGRELAGFESSPSFTPYSKVILWTEEEIAFIAGDDTGRTLEATLPWATQQLAEEILSNIKGFSYQPLTGSDAILDPAAELGDGVTAVGVYGPLAGIDITFDQMFTAEISAPHEEEIDHEYPFVAPRNREFNRKIAQTRSLITKTAEEIRLEVQSEVDNLSSSFSVQLESITAQVNGLNGAYTKLQLTVDGLTVTDSSGTTKIKGSSIETESLVLTGSISFSDLSTDVQDKINAASGITAEEATTLITNKLVASPTIIGAEIFGGVFSDLTDTSYLRMNTSDDGTATSATLVHMYPGYSSSIPLMGMGYVRVGLETLWALMVKGAFVIGVRDNGVIKAYGTWDFSGATVTGI